MNIKQVNAKYKFIMHPRQKGNAPLIKTGLSIEFSNAFQEDIQVGESTSVIYLALDYHMLYPSYIVKRMSEIVDNNKGRKLVLLLYANKESPSSVNDLSVLCFQNKVNMLIAWR
jgi:DNA repair protein Rad10